MFLEKIIESQLAIRNSYIDVRYLTSARTGLTSVRFFRRRSMRISLRKFLRAGSIVALAAAIPVSVLGQSWKDKDGNPVDQGAQPDPLSHYNEAAFKSYLGSIFQVYTGHSVVEVELVRVKDLPTGGPAAPAGGESFSLV